MAIGRGNDCSKESKITLADNIQLVTDDGYVVTKDSYGDDYRYMVLGSSKWINVMTAE